MRAFSIVVEPPLLDDPPRISEARRLIEAWRHDYNHHRPHSKPGWLTPAAYAARWQENEELEGRSSGAFDDDRIAVAPR